MLLLSFACLLFWVVRLRCWLLLFGDGSSKGHTVSAVESKDVDNGMKPKLNLPCVRKDFPVFGPFLCTFDLKSLTYLIADKFSESFQESFLAELFPKKSWWELEN
jgi:hypothetical protein